MRAVVSVVALGVLAAAAGCGVEVKHEGKALTIQEKDTPPRVTEPEGDPRIAPMPRDVTFRRASRAAPQPGDSAGPPAPTPEVAPPPREK